MMGHAQPQRHQVLVWLAITFLFGLGFVGMEVHEFQHLIEEGNGPDRSAFLSASSRWSAPTGCTSPPA